LEISDMLFTVKGPTDGAVLMEWNVKESTQGSAAMWDAHFRVGGAAGTDLDLATCPKGSLSDACFAAHTVFHMTSTSSGYFENVYVTLKPVCTAACV
jgi:glucan 1,3-beta-glucosidase